MPSVQHRSTNGPCRDNFAWTRRNTSAYGQLLARWTHTFRTVTWTSAPIFSSFNRIVWHCASASSVPSRPSLRNAFSNVYAIEEKNSRTWLARIVPALVRSANRCNCCSLIRFSASPRPQSSSSYNPLAARSSAKSDVTTNRGLAPLARCSALATTRRSRLQLSSVRYRNSANTRVGSFVRSNPSRACSCSPAIIATSRGFCASPRMKSTPSRSHQAMIGSRQKPLSARIVILTPGHDPLELLECPGAGVDVGGPQPGAEQVIAAEDGEWEIAIALVIPVEGAAELMAVDRVVGGVEVEHDPRGGLAMGLEEQRHEQPLHLTSVAGDLLVATVFIGPDGGQLEAIEGALTGHGLAAIPTALPGLTCGVLLADDGGQQGVAAEVVVIIEVLVAQCQAVDPLGDQIPDGVLDEVGVAMVGEAGGELVKDGGELLGLAE